MLATLLWSFALSDINRGAEINFLTAIFLNLILAGSLLLTPLVVNALAGKGISSLAATAGGIVAGATMSGPLAFANSVKAKTVGAYQGVSHLGGGVLKRAKVLNEWTAKRNVSRRPSVKNNSLKGKI